MLLYYITHRQAFRGTEAQQRHALITRIADAARAGIDYIQLREKDLCARELERLTREAKKVVDENSPRTRLLVNARTDIALACAADGVHLPADEISPDEARALWRKCSEQGPMIGVSAHSSASVRYAQTQGADFAVLAPIFEKAGTSVDAIGLDALRDACMSSSAKDRAKSASQAGFAVLALGGVMLSNARACLDAGAAGIAGIRLFQNSDIFETVRRLRELGQQGVD